MGNIMEGGNMIDGGSKGSSDSGSTPSLSQGVKYLNKQSGGFRYGIRSRKRRRKRTLKSKEQASKTRKYKKGRRKSKKGKKKKRRRRK